MCNMNIENLEADVEEYVGVKIWGYCSECGTPLSTDMKEDRDWFDVRNCGESFPICRECKEKAERGLKS